MKPKLEKLEIIYAFESLVLMNKEDMALKIASLELLAILYKFVVNDESKLEKKMCKMLKDVSTLAIKQTRRQKVIGPLHHVYTHHLIPEVLFGVR